METMKVKLKARIWEEAKGKGKDITITLSIPPGTWVSHLPDLAADHINDTYNYRYELVVNSLRMV